MSGAELALRLFEAFRTMVDEVHDELAQAGHPGLRPVHGFTLQAIGPGGATAVELAERLGVSKQAAGKTVDGLVARGCVERRADPVDGRRKLLRITPYGQEVLDRSAAAFTRCRDERARRLGPGRTAALEAALRVLTGAGGQRWDAVRWWGTGAD